MPLDYYAVLQVPRNATPEGIRAAYRSLAREHHPDASGVVDDAAFKRIAEAYGVLSDARKRTIYDAQLIARERGSTRGPHHSDA